MKPTERKTNAPETRRRREKILYSAAVVVLFGLFAFQLWFHAVRTSATFDEPAHTVAGYRYWQCGDFGINPEHPPLLKLLSTVSLNFRASLIEPKAECGARLTPKLEMFNLGGVFLSDNGVDSVLIPARLLAALMSLVLAALMFLATREMFGRWEAIVALAILAFEPILIAHGSLVTTDMALMATAFGAVYALYRYLKNPTWARFLIIGLAFGLMLAAKHSAVIFVPVLLAVFIADAVFNRKFGERLPKLIFRRVAAFAGFFSGRFTAFDITPCRTRRSRRFRLTNISKRTVAPKQSNRRLPPSSGQLINFTFFPNHTRSVSPTSRRLTAATPGFTDTITPPGNGFIFRSPSPSNRASRFSCFCRSVLFSRFLKRKSGAKCFLY
jgi:dolichyl-phosphate-mannose--protein O-mannosyl transferase